MLNYFDSRPPSTSTACGGNADRATRLKKSDHPHRWRGNVMLKRTLKHLAALLLLAAVITPAPVLAQTPSCTGPDLDWTGIVPDCLSPGASYRILFVTSGARDSSSSDIAVYNTFVQAQADGATGTPFSGITFNALGSTPSTNARDNTGTNPNSDGVGERIFYYLGEQVADNYADLYDGEWDSTDPRDETGSPSPTVNSFGSNVVRVYTGSEIDGTSATPSFLRKQESSQPHTAANKTHPTVPESPPCVDVSSHFPLIFQTGFPLARERRGWVALRTGSQPFHRASVLSWATASSRNQKAAATSAPIPTPTTALKGAQVKEHGHSCPCSAGTPAYSPPDYQRG